MSPDFFETHQNLYKAPQPPTKAYNPSTNPTKPQKKPSKPLQKPPFKKNGAQLFCLTMRGRFSLVFLSSSAFKITSEAESLG